MQYFCFVNVRTFVVCRHNLYLVSAISIVGMDWNSLAGRSAVRSAGMLVLASSLAGLVRSEAEPQFTFESSSRYEDSEI